MLFPLLLLLLVLVPAAAGTTGAVAVVGRGPLYNTSLPDPHPNATYNHTFRHFDNKTEGALQCQASCDADGPRCAGWTYITGLGDTGGGLGERCSRHSALGCPVVAEWMISGARTASAPCSRPAGPSPPPPSRRLSGGARTLLFLDDHPLNLRENVARVVGSPRRVSSYTDPSPELCTNWGYPSVYQCVPPATRPAATWCMMYEAQTFPDHDVYMLVAASEDGVDWAPRDTTSELPSLEGRK